MHPVASSDSTDNTTQIVIHAGGERLETAHDVEAEEQAAGCGGDQIFAQRFRRTVLAGVYLLVASLITAVVIHIDKSLDTNLLDNAAVVGALRNIVEQAFNGVGVHSTNTTRKL